MNEPLSQIMIDARVKSVAIRVCQRGFNNSCDCPNLFRKRTLEVKANDGRLNAFAGTYNDPMVLGAL